MRGKNENNPLPPQMTCVPSLIKKVIYIWRAFVQKQFMCHSIESSICQNPWLKLIFHYYIHDFLFASWLPEEDIPVHIIRAEGTRRSRDENVAVVPFQYVHVRVLVALWLRKVDSLTMSPAHRARLGIWNPVSNKSTIRGMHDPKKSCNVESHCHKKHND